MVGKTRFHLVELYKVYLQGKLNKIWSKQRTVKNVASERLL